jgi:thioredoxin 1
MRKSSFIGSNFGILLFFIIFLSIISLNCKLKKATEFPQIKPMKEEFKLEDCTILDFSAEWCPPCRRLKPIIEELKEEYKGINFHQVDIDKERDLAEEFNIEVVPTLVFIFKEKELNRYPGFLNKPDFKRLIEEVFTDVLRQDIKSHLEAHAKKEGYKLNPEINRLNALLTALTRNKLIYGATYCPCRLKKIEENICPCLHHKEEIKKEGRCLCGLFIK